MASPFLHLEILGPRSTLDQWLSVLQDHGGCHLADALVDLDREPGIARPISTPDERDAEVRRSEAAHLLRSVERVLPRTPPREVFADLMDQFVKS